LIRRVCSGAAEKHIVSRRAAGDHDVEIGCALNDWDKTAGLQRVHENLRGRAELGGRRYHVSRSSEAQAVTPERIRNTQAMPVEEIKDE
jgi:hypothetical protein